MPKSGLVPHVWSEPIRLGGTLGALLLAGPGALTGLFLLLSHAGTTVPIRYATPQTHGLIQLGGFFLIATWGFLVHGLGGMLGANRARMARLRYAMLGLAAVLFGRYTADVLDTPVIPWAVATTLVCVAASALLLTASAASFTASLIVGCA